MQYEHLFSPIKIGSRTAKNRIVLPSHGVALPFFEDSAEGSKYIAYQTARAKGGSGLNIIGSCAVHKSTILSASQDYTSAPTHEIFIPKLKRMADSVHEYGTLLLLQLWVYGNQYTSPPGRANWGFTSLAAMDTHEVCHEMDDDEINEVIDSFATYTKVAKEGGMDGVEVHACHGDLVQQSWSRWANQRTDKWGEPMAFSTELARRMRAVAGKDFIICFRITGDDFVPGGMDNAANQNVARALEATGDVDILNISFGYGGSSYSYTTGGMYIPPASISVPLASGIKQAVKSIPVVACSRINEPTLAENILADGHADMVGLVRALIADPEFPNKAREGRTEDIRLCIACNQGCWEGQVMGALDCTQNVMAGRESDVYGTIKAAPEKKKVLVVGGGPGGMESARVAAIRGHEVTLYEKENRLGGQINTLSKAPGREEFSQVTRYLSTQLPKLGVKIKLGCEATLETIKKENPDAVVIATGSKPYIESVPGCDQSNVFNPSQVLNGEAEVGNNVLVYDSTGFQEGLTVADFLAERGKKVELLTIFPIIGASWGLHATGFGTHVPILWQRLNKNGVKITPVTEVKAISQKKVRVMDVWTNEERTITAIDTVIMATGYRSNNTLYMALKGRVKELYAVGDCYAPKRALDAIHSGFKTAFKI
jgi:2,4-dienoyl-CoA reductase-like NADH-dependent reductase (Old Yellow Enzyme family)/thioredoxin reductase